MATLLQDENRNYQRIRHSAEEKIILANRGFQHVLSSNVSAIALEQDDLIIRFHNGSIYRYPNKGDLYEAMLKSNSKGRFVYTRLRKTNTPYNKIGSLPLESDIPLSDDELFGKVDENANLERLIGDPDKRINQMGLTSKENKTSPILQLALVGLVATLLPDLFFTTK